MWKRVLGLRFLWDKEVDLSITFIRPIFCHLPRKYLSSPYPMLLLTLFGSGRFVEYLLERQDVQRAWKEHTEHAFVAGMADGTLPIESFKFYLIQDYLFLVRMLTAKHLLWARLTVIDSICKSKLFGSV